MSATVSLSQTAIFTALVAVLGTFGLTSSIAGQAVPIIQGQVNRVPEPNAQDFLVLWPIARDRIAMNIDTWQDTSVTGSIADNVLTATAVTNGPAAAGQTLYAPGVTPGCQIVRQLSGVPGGAGTYALTPTAPVSATTIWCGTISALQETEITIQCDVHGPASADNAQRLSTLFRDQFGVSAFEALGVALSPLYTSEPRQIPFDNGEQQVEERWVVDLCMQADIAVTTTMQFADQFKAATTPVETLASS